VGATGLMDAMPWSTPSFSIWKSLAAQGR
jgi:hypothetical protein